MTPTERAGTTLLSMRGICKRYAGTIALDLVDLDISRGSVHALVGENGAGKSTLGKIIGGAVRRDSGHVTFDGLPVDYRSPQAALRDGVAIIQQELALVPGMTVVENVYLGKEQSRFGLLKEASLREKYDELCERSGFHIRPDAIVGDLRIADRQKVEIIRALARDAKIIVMDEPTSSLTPDEVRRLARTIRDLREAGTSIVYVSHFLEEVLEFSDRVTVLRNGRLVRTTDAADETVGSLIEGMLGREFASSFPAKASPIQGAETVLEVSGLSTKMLRNVSFTVQAGEIVGLGGLVGSGRTETLRAIFGADRITSGTVAVDGQIVRSGAPQRAVAAGLALIPESRKEEGLVMTLPLSPNITLPHFSRTATDRLGFIRRRFEFQQVLALLDRLSVKPRKPNAAVESLSGGNQQKVLFAKWLYREPRVLLLDEPTRGVDVGARRAIHDVVAEVANRGIAVVVVSSDVDELIGLAHRTLVMRRGAIVAEFGHSPTTTQVMNAAFGMAAATDPAGDAR